MTIKEFRQNQMLVDWWRKTFNRKEFQAIWQIMADLHPMRYTDSTPITTPSAERKLGEIQGYELALGRLKELTDAMGDEFVPEPTFEPTDQLEQEP